MGRREGGRGRGVQGTGVGKSEGQKKEEEEKQNLKNYLCQPWLWVKDKNNSDQNVSPFPEKLVAQADSSCRYKSRIHHNSEVLVLQTDSPA